VRERTVRSAFFPNAGHQIKGNVYSPRLRRRLEVSKESWVGGGESYESFFVLVDFYR